MAHPSFLGIPPEIRQVIYDFFLWGLQQVPPGSNVQPANEHMRLLQVCTVISREAGASFRQYVSLRHEQQIRAFILRPTLGRNDEIVWADVANDGRHLVDLNDGHATPVSSLHIALRDLTSLRVLRVFEVRRGHPMGANWRPLVPQRISERYESLMYPHRDLAPALERYELYLDRNTKIKIFEVIPTSSLKHVRLSGTVRLTENLIFPSLRSLSLAGLQGNFFDTRGPAKCFQNSSLDSFAHAQINRESYELRDWHLRALVARNSLTHLILLQSAHLSSQALADCVCALPELVYVAISLVLVEELGADFVSVLPPTVDVFKLQLIRGRFAPALLVEQLGLLESIETHLIHREHPLRLIAIGVSEDVLEHNGRSDEWRNLARQRGVELRIGNWEANESI